MKIRAKIMEDARTNLEDTNATATGNFMERTASSRADRELARMMAFVSVS